MAAYQASSHVCLYAPFQLPSMLNCIHKCWRGNSYRLNPGRSSENSICRQLISSFQQGSFIEAARIELFDDIVKGLIDAVDNTKKI